MSFVAAQAEVDEIVDLCQRLHDGSREAFAEIYQRWSRLIYSFSLKALGDIHDAEEVTQLTFVAAWRSRHTLRPAPAALPGWLVGIAKHQISELRRQKQRILRNDHALVALEQAPPELSDLALQITLSHELEALGDPRATILRMAFIDDRTHQAISEQLNLPLGTIKSHIRRGLLQLRQRIKEVE